MAERKKQLISKILVLSICANLVPVTVAFADQGTNKVINQSVTITPTEIKVTGITINESSNINISTKGGTVTLTTNILPSTATNKTVTWTSSDISIANVSNQGIVTAISNGSVTITATAADGSKIAGAKVITVTGQTTTSNSDSNSVLKSVDISGTEEVGHKLKAKVKYNGTEPSLKYQWQRASKKDGDYIDISGADEKEYKLKSNDKKKYVKVIATATINGINYEVKDITSKIDRDTSDDDDDDDSSNSSKSRSTYNSNKNSIWTPSTTMNNSKKTMELNTSISNGILPVNVEFTNPSGYPVIGWIKVFNKWYCLDYKGMIKIGWVEDNGKWYYLDQTGVMASNTTVDGYWLGEDGAMI